MDLKSIFKDLKVVEFAGVLAGPAVGMFFAELGAEVIKIENKTTGGDMTRGWKLPVENPESPISAYFCSVNWGKQYLLLNLSDSSDLDLAMKHVREADIVISNFRPASARRLGVDDKSLCALNERLIYAQINAFADPDDERPAFDVVLQAEAGFLYMNGEPERPPVKMPVALIDLLAAHQLKEAILIALLQRERTGKGCVVSTSLLKSALASLANQASNYLMTGHIPQPMGTRHPNIAPYGDIFTCADGEPILLAVGTERQFRQLCAVLGLDDLANSKEFDNNEARVRHRTSLNLALAEAIGKWTFSDLMGEFNAKRVPAARIRNMASVFEMPESGNMILEERTPDGTDTRRMQTTAFTISNPL
ncbi:MAG: CoA transferase [Lewinellaceae bacterium]|nr:CoA transferase [Lewinellaceae bacterium]